ncbi:MAG: NAD-dependent epimerase/dehydratase family protein, partial [Byssovorax sp.]
SLRDPVEDFEINARGTLNVLEAIRRQPSPVPLIFTSTNKVYGALPDVALRERGLGGEPEEAAVRARGISEARALDFHSPYGCSKGAADQYVLDYARSFGLDAAVLRMSCIYGVRQLGSEEQGWVAHFAIQALRGAPITVYGDGLQVRDVLFIDDLVNAVLVARAAMPRIRGGAFNLGGGPEQTASLLEVIELLEEVGGRRPTIRFEAARPGDQRWYVSDLQRFEGATGWAPHVRLRDGLARLCAFLRDTGIGVAA